MPGQKGQELHRNDPLRDGKGSVYEGGIRVPFIIRGPSVEHGTISTVPVTGLVIFPTIAELAGYTPALPKALDGGSMTSVMFNGGQGKVERNKPFLLFHQAVARSAETALMLDNYKLVKTWSKDQLELFDLSQGPEETHDLSKSQPEKTSELHDLMVGFLEEVGAETQKTGTKSEVYERAKPKPDADSSAQQRANTDLPTVAASRRKPNVLFLAIDDLNDWIGALGGHPQAKTPNLDRLISRSVVFSNAHCAAPVCAASRHALMSGLRPSTTGWYSNTSKKLADYETTLDGTLPMPTHFKRSGYKTMAAGKIFHKGTSDVAGYEYWTEKRPKYRWPKRVGGAGPRIPR